MFLAGNSQMVERKRHSKIELLPWQEEIFRLVDDKKSPKVTWVWDRFGNTGKSFLAQYLEIKKTVIGPVCCWASGRNYKRYVGLCYSIGERAARWLEHQMKDLSPAEDKDHILIFNLYQLPNGLPFDVEWFKAILKIASWSEARIVVMANFLPWEKVVVDLIVLDSPRGKSARGANQHRWQRLTLDQAKKLVS
jgi:hypothetical protein